MKSFSKVILLTIALAGTILIFKSNFQNLQLSSNFIEEIVDSKRNLQTLDKNEFNTVCVNEKVDLGFFTNFNPYADTFEQYLVNSTDYKDKYNADLEVIIVDKDTSGLGSFIVKIFGGWLIIIIFAVITLLAWFFFCGCCCCPCCCCRSENEEEGICTYKGFNFIISIIALLGIVIVCIIGFVLSAKVPNNFNQIECSLMKFYVDFRFGDNKTEAPRWPGIPNLISIMTSLRDSLDPIAANSATTNYNTASVEAQENNYNNLLNQKWTTNQNTVLRSPNPSTSGEVTPTIISSYGPPNLNSTVLWELSNEYQNTIKKSTNELKTFRDKGVLIGFIKEEGKSAFNSVINVLNPFNDEIVTFDTDYIEKFRDAKSKAMSSIRIAFIIFFVVILVCAIAFLLFSFIYVSCKKDGCRYMSYLFCNIIFLITIPIFIVGGVFGLLGTAFILLPSFMQVLFSQEGLQAIISDKQVSDSINSCVNGNGNLKPILLPKSQFIDEFEIFYRSAAFLDVTHQRISVSTDSQLAISKRDTYQAAIQNVNLINGTGINAPQTAMNELNSYTFDSASSKISSCSSKTRDFWVSSQTDCPKDYTFISPSNAVSGLGDQSCLNVREWTSSSVATRYANRPSCSGLDPKTSASNYVSSINSYATAAEPLLNSLRTDMIR